MKSVINELWHGNIIPQEDSRTNSKEIKELLGYISRHHEDLKARDMLRWVAEMNNIKASAEETVLREVVYV